LRLLQRVDDGVDAAGAAPASAGRGEVLRLGGLPLAAQLGLLLDRLVDGVVGSGRARVRVDLDDELARALLEVVPQQLPGAHVARDDDEGGAALAHEPIDLARDLALVELPRFLGGPLEAGVRQAARLHLREVVGRPLDVAAPRRAAADAGPPEGRAAAARLDDEAV